MNQTAVKHRTQVGKKKKKNVTYGWDVFNEDSLYRAYDKRCLAIPHYRDEYLKQKSSLEAGEKKSDSNLTGAKRKLDPEKLDVLVADIEKQRKKR